MPPRNVAQPPSSVTGELGRYLTDVAAYLNALPQWSLASFGPTETPNSRVTGATGALCVNLGSGSTSSRLWQLGTISDRTDQGWQLLRVVAP